MTSEDTVNTLSQKTGASSKQVSMLITLALPLLIKYLTKNASSQSGAQSLLGALMQHTNKNSMADQVAQADEEDGKKILQHILGDRSTDVMNDLAGKTAPEESGNPAPENVVCDKCFGLDDGAVALIPGDAQASFTRIAARISDESSRERMLQFVDLSTLDERMRGVNTVTEEFLNCCNKWCRTRFIAEKRDDAGQLVRVIWLVELIDRERRQREKLQHLAEIDQMTGICNRGTVEHRISELLSEKQSGMFLLLDIDKFKQYNDTYGHKVGDQVIISVAKALTASFRSYDVVMRLGGDEFAVYALGLTTRDKAQAVIERLLRNIQAIRIPEIGDRSVYVSAGAAFYRGDGDIAFQEIYEQADGCAYMSKKDAGNAVTYFNS